MKYFSLPLFAHLPWNLLHYFTRAVITGSYRWGGLNNKNLFPQSSGGLSPSQGVSRVGSFWGLSSWLADGSFLPVSSHGLPSVYVWVLNSSCKTRVVLGLTASFCLNYLFNTPLQVQSHFEVCVLFSPQQTPRKWRPRWDLSKDASPSPLSPVSVHHHSRLWAL